MTTLANLISRAQAASDIGDGDNDFVNRTMWVYWANAERSELLVRIARMGYPWSIQPIEITVSGAVSYYIIPNTYIAIVGVYRKLTDGNYTKLAYRSAVDRSFIDYSASGDATAFSLRTSGTDSYITLSPNPSTGSYLIDVIPHPVDLVADADNTNLPLNWDDRIVLGMARRALAREETINPSLENQIQLIDNYIDNSVWDWLLQQNNTAGKVSLNDVTPYFVF